MTQLRVEGRTGSGASDVLALRRTEEHLELALSAARLGNWEFDLTTRRLTASHQCKANHGLAPDEDFQLDSHLIPAIDPAFRQPFRDALDSAVASGGSFEIEVPHRWPDGTRHWILIAGRVIDPTCLVGVTKDITLRREGEEALRASEERLRESDRMKDEFLAVVAHELRGPLQPILMAVKLLDARSGQADEAQRLRATIERQAQQLAKLVDDLLEIGRITSGKLRVTRTRSELGAIVTQAVETCAPLIEKRRHTLHTHLPDSAIHVLADAARIVQVVSNLLSNAAKYMHDGGRIDLTVEEHGGHAEIRVHDEGVGIAPEMLSRIFNRFVQVGSSAHRDEGGLGIGLSLVKAVVELHGGSVEARSEGIGTGSEFIVRLPVG
jgi:signal transduction histidine kinase